MARGNKWSTWVEKNLIFSGIMIGLMVTNELSIKWFLRIQILHWYIATNFIFFSPFLMVIISIYIIKIIIHI